MKNQQMTEEDRIILFKIFTDLQENYHDLKSTLRRVVSEYEYNVASAYWLASLNVGLDGSEYFTYNPTFQKFLEDAEIMNEDGEFIELEDPEE